MRVALRPMLRLDNQLFWSVKRTVILPSVTGCYGGHRCLSIIVKHKNIIQYETKEETKLYLSVARNGKQNRGIADTYCR